MGRLVNRKNASELIKHVPGGQRAEVLDHILDNDSVAIAGLARAGVVVGAAVPIAAGALVAWALAGKTTTLNVTITVAITVALGGVAATLAVILNGRLKTIRELKARNAELSQGLHQLQARLRHHNLDDTITPPTRP